MSGPGQQDSGGWQDYAPPAAAQAQGWQDYKEPSAASPIAPPAIQKPTIPMHRSFLIGDPDKDIDSRAVQMEPITNAVKGLASASAPVIAHRIAQKVAPGVVPKGDMYQGETSLGDLPDAAEKTFANTMVGPLMGEPLAGESAEEKPAQIANPSAAAKPPAGIVDRAGEVALRRLNHIPGVQAAKDANYILRGPGETAAPEAAAPPARIAKPTSEQSALENSKDFGTPQELRGKRIPQEPPELSSPSRTLPGQIGREVIRPKTAPAAELPPRNGPLLLPSHGDAILDQMRPYADRIMREGHGDEIPSEDEQIAAPPSTDMEEDLTPALKASLARVRAAKASRIARPN